jgi:predicted ATPase
MEGKRLLRSLTLRNVLSFGPEAQTLEFEPLNVLIGPNGSGKSNLIDILGLLRSLPVDLSAAIHQQGVFRHWIWKGSATGTHVEIESTWNDGSNLPPLRHRIALGLQRGRAAAVVEERIDRPNFPFAEYKYQTTNKNEFSGPDLYDHIGNTTVAMDQEGFRNDQSILSQRRDSERYPFLTSLGTWLVGIRLYRDWVFGRSSEARRAQDSELPNDYLAEDASNLYLVLKRLLNNEDMNGTKIQESLKSLYDGINGIHVRDIGEHVHIEIREDRERTIPASRLSDGTLRYLSLLAILCDPAPAPLICIEEPELGLHPDIMPTIAKLLIDASQRTQLIVTTHSADLISALWECPESVVVCERGIGGTTLNRLEPKKLKKWLKDYSLGHLWSMGEIGGNRW